MITEKKMPRRKVIKTRPIEEYFPHRQVFIHGPVNQRGEPPDGDNLTAKCGICCHVAAGRGHNMRYDRCQAWKRFADRRTRAPILIDLCDPCRKEHRPYDDYTELLIWRRDKWQAYKYETCWRMND